MIYIGIDPGSKTGAMAIIGNNDIQIHPFNERLWSEELNYIVTVNNRSNIFAIVEKVHSMPRQGVASTFSFGTNFGFIQGMLSALNIGYQLVTPQVWKREFGLNDDKNASIITAQRLYPEINLKRTERSRTYDSNMAEALLMAEYGRRLHGRKD